MPLKAIHSPNACVVRPDSSALRGGRSARRLVRWMSTVASTTTQMLRGRIVVGGAVAVTASARVRSSSWKDAPKMVVLVWCSTLRPSACRLMRTEARPTVGVHCWVPDASVKLMISVSLGMGRRAIAVG